ncbi:MAG: hypothetical protein JWN77_1215 [Frankiales bacterium]|nr:hypothetical protein [Frankiales bacterium]
MQIEFRWCAACASEQLFEQPPCDDGHGEDCLDLSCVECGSAVVLGHAQVDEPVLPAVRAA